MSLRWGTELASLVYWHCLPWNTSGFWNVIVAHSKLLCPDMTTAPDSWRVDFGKKKSWCQRHSAACTEQVEVHCLLLASTPCTANYLAHRLIEWKKPLTWLNMTYHRVCCLGVSLHLYVFHSNHVSSSSLASWQTSVTFTMVQLSTASCWCPQGSASPCAELLWFETLPFAQTLPTAPFQHLLYCNFFRKGRNHSAWFLELHLRLFLIRFNI